MANQHQHREGRHHPFFELPPCVARRVGVLRRASKERLVALGTIQLLHLQRLDPLAVNQVRLDEAKEADQRPNAKEHHSGQANRRAGFQR